jgi:hypothetical protein
VNLPLFSEFPSFVFNDRTEKAQSTPPRNAVCLASRAPPPPQPQADSQVLLGTALVIAAVVVSINRYYFRFYSSSKTRHTSITGVLLLN